MPSNWHKTRDKFNRLPRDLAQVILFARARCRMFQMSTHSQRPELFLKANALKTSILERVAQSRQRTTASFIIRQIRASLPELSSREVRCAIQQLVTENQLAYRCEFGNTYLVFSHQRPVQLSPRVVVKPPEKAFAADPAQCVIEIEAGEAFGSGAHATTRLALWALEMALDAFQRTARNIDWALDIGTGNGILAIAAAKMGARRVQAIDTDGCARFEARTNVERNGLQDRISVSDKGLDDFQGRWDLILANLRLPTIVSLSPVIQSRLKSGGMFVVSGIQKEECPGLQQRLAATGLKVIWSRHQMGWVGLLARPVKGFNHRATNQ